MNAYSHNDTDGVYMGVIIIWESNAKEVLTKPDLYDSLCGLYSSTYMSATKPYYFIPYSGLYPSAVYTIWSCVNAHKCTASTSSNASY